MNRTVRHILALVLTLFLTAGLLVVLRASALQRHQVLCREVRVTVTDSLQRRFVTEKDVVGYLAEYGRYIGERIDSVDLGSFKLQAYNVATDRNHVYRYGKILPLADPATYIEQWKGLYSRDKDHVWYCGQLIDDADCATFVIDKDGARDKHGHFYRGERITDEQWQQIVKERDSDDL